MIRRATARAACTATTLAGAHHEQAWQAKDPRRLARSPRARSARLHRVPPAAEVLRLRGGCCRDVPDLRQAAARGPALSPDRLLQGEVMSGAPMQYGFEYEVKIAVSIPLAWATLLKEAATHHYDYKCRESGKQGVVNALFNTAQGGPLQSNYPVTFRDLDLVSKVAEQIHHHTS